MLQIDCLSTDTLPPAACPTFLFYNPYGVAKQVTIGVGSSPKHLYDAVTGAFLATNVTGNASFPVSPDTAIVLVQCPATGVVSQASQKLLVSGIVIDYWNATRDTDGDGLPDWWESRFFSNITNAAPQSPAANGFNNLQCCLLGLDPTNPESTFRVRAERQAGTGYPCISWNSVGGKTYALDYANTLATTGSTFLEACLTTETNVAAGVETTATFVDNYTLTGGPPGASGRYYRVRWVGP
jgi:hypothetical protein